MFSVWKNGAPAHRRYLLRTFGLMSVYVALCMSAMAGAFDAVIGRPSGWMLAAAVSLPVVGQIWATLALMRESDEFVRAVAAKQFIVAAGLAMGGATLWGFGESFAGAPHVPAWLIYPLFWAAFGLVTPFIRESRP